MEVNTAQDVSTRNAPGGGGQSRRASSSCRRRRRSTRSPTGRCGLLSKTCWNTMLWFVYWKRTTKNKITRYIHKQQENRKSMFYQNSHRAMRPFHQNMSNEIEKDARQNHVLSEAPQGDPRYACAAFLDLPTKIIRTKISWLKFSGETPHGLKNVHTLKLRSCSSQSLWHPESLYSTEIGRIFHIRSLLDWLRLGWLKFVWISCK